MAHMDTVPLCAGARPVRDGAVVRAADPHTALGADNRAGVGVLLTAALNILEQKLPHPPLTFFFPVQEEIGLYGARFANLSKLGSPKLCFNWDGSLPHAACLGATGDYALEILVHGVASHAGVCPERGVSAIAVAALAIADLQENGWHGLIVKGKRTGTSNVGVIQAGEATNVVTPSARIRAEVRSHDPQFRVKIVQAYEKAFQKAARRVQSTLKQRGRIDFRSELKYESFRLEESEPCVKEALRAIAAAGLRPETRISNGGLDANWLSCRGLPTVTLGCGQQEVHTVHETLLIEDYWKACQIGLILATNSAVD
jgi:tripeptide aminopeptidase